MPNKKDPIYTGLFPVAPTPFTESGDLDTEGQRRVIVPRLMPAIVSYCQKIDIAFHQVDRS
ncbi:hypothetical protein [Bradyrhizobium sp. 193]|uniref:hypothetical protein n=1 Tax=Bradyrhizobium sp. 193 TaxID=2782661 RepID=UPI003211BEA3